MVLPFSDNEPNDDNEPGDDKLSSGCQSAGDESEVESEMTPEKELGM